jgi:hypothetical protein
MNIEAGGTVARFSECKRQRCNRIGTDRPLPPLHAGMHACL